MLEDIFQRKDVCDFIEDILSDPRYLKKKNSNINNQNFIESQQCLFIFLDALFKYVVIIDERKYLSSYIAQVRKLISKVDDYVDINIGLNRIIGSFCALKLGLSDLSSYHEKEKIVKYVYDKYIVNGYFFHGYSGCYRSQIAKYGMVPEQYQHFYPKLNFCKEIFEKHGCLAIQKDFSKKELYFTDSFLMGCYYGVNAPSYFSRLLVGNDCDLKNYNKSAYYKNDFFGCFDNLNKLMKKYSLSDNEKKMVIKTCTDVWKSLGMDNTNINILMVKRSYFGLNYLNDITKIVYSVREGDLSDALGKIFNSRRDDILVTGRLDSSIIQFVEIPNYPSLMYLRDEHIKDLTNVRKMTEKYDNAYGMASVLAILGSLLVTIGVIITIIMISRGI